MLAGLQGREDRRRHVDQLRLVVEPHVRADLMITPSGWRSPEIQSAVLERGLRVRERIPDLGLHQMSGAVSAR
jgi:hypothetical protein